jgi:hypothetical protein
VSNSYIHFAYSSSYVMEITKCKFFLMFISMTMSYCHGKSYEKMILMKHFQIIYRWAPFILGFNNYYLNGASHSYFKVSKQPFCLNLTNKAL